MTDEQIYDLLSDLAGIDTHDINLRDHPEAYAAVRAAIASAQQLDAKRYRFAKEHDLWFSEVASTTGSAFWDVEIDAAIAKGEKA